MTSQHGMGQEKSWGGSLQLPAVPLPQPSGTETTQTLLPSSMAAELMSQVCELVNFQEGSFMTNTTQQAFYIYSYRSSL